MAELTEEQMHMVEKAVATVGPYGRVEIIVDSDTVTDIEGRRSTKFLKGGKPVKRPKD